MTSFMCSGHAERHDDLSRTTILEVNPLPPSRSVSRFSGMMLDGDRPPVIDETG
jgi:hypothetical protein